MWYSAIFAVRLRRQYPHSFAARPTCPRVFRSARRMYRFSIRAVASRSTSFSGRPKSTRTKLVAVNGPALVVEAMGVAPTGGVIDGWYGWIASPLLEGRVVRGFEGLDVGDTVAVRLVAVDAVQGHIDFEKD